jgi:acetate kinase
MAAVLSGLDTVVFTGGIGENAALVREKVCAGQEWLGFEIDPVRNEAGAEMISTDTSSINVLVIPTDEEAMIRRHTERLLGSAAAGA